MKKHGTERRVAVFRKNEREQGRSCQGENGDGESRMEDVCERIGGGAEVRRIGENPAEEEAKLQGARSLFSPN